MRITIEDFFEWQNKNMETYSKENTMMLYYIKLYKGHIYNRKTIECGYCKKIFIQKIRFENQKHCSYGCQQAAAQLRARLKKNKKNNL